MDPEDATQPEPSYREIATLEIKLLQQPGAPDLVISSTTGETLPLLVVLGMLELARLTFIQQAGQVLPPPSPSPAE